MPPSRIATSELAHPLAIDDPRQVRTRGPDEPAPRLEQHARARGRGVAGESLPDRGEPRAEHRQVERRLVVARTGSRAHHRHRPGGARSRPRLRRRAASSTVDATCAASTSASSRFDAPNAWTPHGSSHGEATASAAAARRSASSMPNLPAPASPMIRTRSASASAVADSRRRTGWTRPAASAIAASRRSSPRDSTVTTRIPAATAAASSSSRLPGPVRTMRLGSKPARRTCRSSPPDATSAPIPRPRRCWRTASSGFALTANARSNDAGSAAAQRLDARRHRVQVVDEERRAEPARERLRVDAGHATGGDERGAPRGERHRSASSSTSRASVPASRSFTSSATVTDRPCARARSPSSARVPGHDDRPGRDGERRVGRPGVHPATNEIVEPRGPGEHDARADHGAGADQHALEERRPGTDERVVLHDDRPRARGLEDAAERHARRQVDAGADLRARADEHVAVDHRVLADPRPDVDERGRHDDDTGPEVHAGTDGRATGHDPPRPAGGERRVRLPPVEERLGREADAVPEAEGAAEVPGLGRAVAEAGEDRGLDLGVGAPPAGRGRIRDGRPTRPGVEVREDRRDGCRRPGRGLERRHAAAPSARRGAGPRRRRLAPAVADAARGRAGAS